MDQINLRLDPSEQAELSELGEVFHTTHSAGWNRIKALMDELAEEAHEDLMGFNGDSSMAERILIRWQQREAINRAVENYVSQCENRRSEILKEIARREEDQERAQLISQIQEGA